MNLELTIIIIFLNVLGTAQAARDKLGGYFKTFRIKQLKLYQTILQTFVYLLCNTIRIPPKVHILKSPMANVT